MRADVCCIFFLGPAKRKCKTSTFWGVPIKISKDDSDQYKMKLPSRANQLSKMTETFGHAEGNFV